jgi:hypothetical protein
VTAPRFNILTSKELTIDLSRPAMEYLSAVIADGCDITSLGWSGWNEQVQCEVDNFRNTLLNLLERSEPETETNLDLV